MDLSIIIVPYNSEKDLEVALDAVFDSQTTYSYEVIVVDNGSSDGTVSMVKSKFLSRPELISKITLYENTNEGFSKGNNRGMKMAKGDYLLLLNPDTKLSPDNLQIMLDFMKAHPEVGMSTSKLIKANGELDWACRRSEPDPKASFYRLSGLQKLWPKKFGSYNVMNKNIDEETEVDACVGAYMMMSRECYEKVGGFDEQFFMYGEDLDLCKRVRKAGYKIWYYPKTYCYHFKGQSSKKSSQKSLYAFHDAMWIYYRKHYKHKYGVLFSGMVYTGIWGRYYLKSFLNFLKPADKKFVSK